MKDHFGHGSNAHGAAMRALKLGSIAKHRKAHPLDRVFTKLRTINKRPMLDNSGAARRLREGSGHKSNPVGAHAAMGGSYAYGKGDGNGY